MICQDLGLALMGNSLYRQEGKNKQKPQLGQSAGEWLSTLFILQRVITAIEQGRSLSPQCLNKKIKVIMVASKAGFVCWKEGSEVTLSTEVSARDHIWWLLSLMPELQGQGQGNQEFEVRLSYKKERKEKYV